MAFGQNDDYSVRSQEMTRAQAEAAEIDVGLRQYMLRTYNYMASGVAFTGIVAALVSQSPELMQAIFGGPMKWVMFVGILGLGFMAPRIMVSKSITAAHGAFWAYAGLIGAWFAPIFLVYTGASIVRVFFITAAAFAGLSLFGYVTKKNLSGFGSFLVMGMWGLLIAIVVNIWLQSPILHLTYSAIGVLIFAGLTAYETQQIKHMYYEGDGHDATTRKSIFGAFMLYGSFVTMFIYLLQLFGQRD